MNIGILGGNEASQTKNILYQLYENKNNPVKIYNLKNEGFQGSLKILIINEKSRNLAHYLSALEKGGGIITNSDDVLISPHLVEKPVQLITYGFNHKASLTTSSVTQNDIDINDLQKLQLCIQRSIPTFSGKVLEEQEFSLEVTSSLTNIYSILGAVTAALLDDVYRP